VNPIVNIAKQLHLSEIPADNSNIESTIAVANAVLKELVDKNSTKLADHQFHTRISTSESIFSLEACVNCRNNTVYLTPLYFVNRKDVPFTGPDDESLKDNNKLQEFANKLAAHCKIPEKKVTWQDRMNLRMYLAATQKQKKTRDMISFILMHELGHVHHNHYDRERNYQHKFTKGLYLGLNKVTFGIFKKLALNKQSRNHEAEADAFAYKAFPKYAKGGVHLFKTVTKFKPKGLLEKFAYTLFYLSTLSSHGTFTIRGQRIKKYMKSNR